MKKYQDFNPRKKEITPLKEAFEELLQAYKLKDRFNERKIVSAWGEMMGNSIASRTSSIYAKDKKLFVKLSSGPIKKELMMNKSRIIHIIEEKFGKGAIEDITFL
ncbi:DUF721 domain-containing protein [Echinicola vietnamensis]|uniref:RNA-binding protein containing Zn ribbon n=1 Tax=Echinicola vietnamensis (strain DSM 17526 / LMG 23754 / KMM 6221) TaxID=926556 RepID=L0FUC9_ECHVK|nr:DUF721 domain-containing protein [Echinicola vietnamensis]AGA76907.1 Protein of unknown function (DUF721) [Echinicola vietnamensis DSM 17526]